ncbi:inorganic phosphate transporter [Cylindrobasidium torrendii FP15055 ss-10]|uniref:Inorganic phosphate transporter n=1 Tax=Cylindrobasidium torrendii FP15055 ss-10 TaxID=1314674 RepID=A0A0D7B8B7_9AGAR|nr:inorganic phosphate transporter [Cylindrobasidium torrendii FP15055 ss-10]
MAANALPGSSTSSPAIANATKKRPTSAPAHYTLDERRRAALAEVDNAKFSWFHVKVVCVAGVGFFADAYDIFAINIASVMIGYVYGGWDYTLSTDQDLAIKVATPIGTLVGQLLFGWLADVVGRKRMYGVELIIMIVGTFGQCLSANGHAINIFGVLVVWRFIMGVGIGGDYPTSAVVSSEFAATRLRGRLMTATFAFQGWGNLAAALVGLVVTVIYKDKILANPDGYYYSVDRPWRLLIGLGCVPGVLALYFRLTIPESPRYTMDVLRNLEQAENDIDSVNKELKGHDEGDLESPPRAQAPKASWADFKAHFGQWKNGKVLLGTAWSWFALDIAFYGLGLNSSIVIKAIGFGTPKGVTGSLKVYKDLKNICVGNIILSVGGLIPGYWFCFLFIDKWGRKPIQLMGFIVLTALFIVMGFGYNAMMEEQPGRSAFVWLYCMCNFFQNFEPNTTTFVIPGEVFPTRYRSTAHGISAASGKLGAIVAQVGFARLKNIHGKDKFLNHILEIFAFFMMTGIFSTLLLPETMGRSLEELSNESQDSFYRAPTSSRGIEERGSEGTLRIAQNEQRADEKV